MPLAIEALRFVGLGVEVERAVGDRAQLAVQLVLELVEDWSPAAPWTCGSTRSDTGGCGASASRASPSSSSASRACTRAWPGSPFSSPTRAEYGRVGAHQHGGEGPSSVAWSSAEAARTARAAAIAGASGAPLTRARPSSSLEARRARGPRWPAHQPLRHVARPPTPRPRRRTSERDGQSAIVSPAVPGLLAGTTGSSRRSAGRR